MTRASRGRLARADLARPAPEVARRLLGARVVVGERRAIIVETEAYLGEADQASHARFGPTARSAIMFGPAGVAYVYLIYGMHEMFNVVTGTDGEAAAVLIRAVALDGGATRAGSGPGKLTRALGITRQHNGVDLTRSRELYLEAGEPIARGRIARGPRIGVAYAGAWADRPYRFWIADHPAVSR